MAFDIKVKASEDDVLRILGAQLGAGYVQHEDGFRENVEDFRRRLGLPADGVAMQDEAYLRIEPEAVPPAPVGNWRTMQPQVHIQNVVVADRDALVAAWSSPASEKTIREAVARGPVHAMHTTEAAVHERATAVCCGQPMATCGIGSISGRNSRICRVCERFEHWNGNRTPGPWWHQPTGLCAAGGPFLSTDSAAAEMIVDILSHSVSAPDPLDAVIDGWRLRDLLQVDSQRQREESAGLRGDAIGRFTPAQRAAVSLHHSTEIRAKVAASKAADAARRPSVCMQIDAEDL